MTNISRVLLCGLVSLVLGLPCPASAATFTVAGSGTTTDVHDSDQKAITGQFSAGDAYTLDVSADLDAATLWFRSSDNATAFYNLPVAYSLQIGSFLFKGASTQTLSITNDTTCSGFCSHADSTYLLSLGFNRVNGTPPFDLGAGTYWQSISIQFFDFDGGIFDGTGLDQLARIDRFGAPKLSYQSTQVDAPARAAFASFTNAGLRAAVVDAVPDAPTWTSLILGFGVLGWKLRRRSTAWKPGLLRSAN